jgi:glycosyltransferase involved in cell wall biosynthesis
MQVLDYLNLCYIYFSAYPSLLRTWHAAGTRDELRVSYGYDRVPGPDEHVFGGLVKLQDLNKAFPQSTRQPNILYLVSSALPYFPVRLAKMAKKSGAKLVINQNGVAYPGWFGKGWQRQNRSITLLHSYTDYVFYQSHFCKLSTDKFVSGRSDNFEILYNPVDTEVFCPQGHREKDNDIITLLLAGSHWSLYRPQIALEVLRLVSLQNQKVQLKIAGRFCWGKTSIAAEKQVRNLAISLGVADRVEYLGPYTQQQAVQLLQQCSILLHTKYNDPCPRLVVEAMACGVPVVYSATGGTPELVGEKGGVGIPGQLDWAQDHPPKSEAMAEGVLQVIENLSNYAMSARLRAVDRFDVRHWYSRHKIVFEKLLSS